MAAKLTIPNSLVENTTEQRGPAGVEWLARLPSILAECERRWHIVLGPPFPQLSYNYAAPATREDGTPVVVKVCFSSEELGTEAGALRHYGGRGAVRLLDVDVDLGVMLLEYVRPGSLLVEVEDDREATSIAASVMRQLLRPITAEDARLFPSVGDWARGMAALRERFDGGTGPFPAKLVEQAEGLFAELLGSMGQPVLLHGDLHHFNIVRSERQPWLAIDPKGVVGEAAYETGALLRNPMPAIYSAPDLARLTARRIDQLAEELDMSRERIRGWAIAQAVLSAWWYIDDGRATHSNLQIAIVFAETLASTLSE